MNASTNDGKNTDADPPNNTETDDKIEHKSIDLILEGGSFHTDGDGIILTTSQCLLNPNRNPTLTKSKIERNVLSHLGATKTLWLPYGLAFDEDTNGHVDNMATFVRPGEVLLSWTDEEGNGGEGEVEKNYERCRVAEEVLKWEEDAKGRKVKIHRLNLPRHMVSKIGIGTVEFLRVVRS